MAHTGGKPFGRPRRARRRRARSWPVRLYRAIRDAARERAVGARSVAAAGLLLLAGAAVALSPIAIGEFVTAVRGDVRPGYPATSPAPVPLPAPPLPTPPLPAPPLPAPAPDGPGPAEVPDDSVAPPEMARAMGDDHAAAVRVRPMAARDDHPRHPAEDRNEADDGAEDREEDDARGSSGATGDGRDVQGESEQVRRDREKVEREREEIEAERERIEDSR